MAKEEVYMGPQILWHLSCPAKQKVLDPKSLLE